MLKSKNFINDKILVLPAAGISNGQDVYNTIALGAEATGSTSGIIKADDRSVFRKFAANRQCFYISA